jgi:predicted nucleic acid-binding protein
VITFDTGALVALERRDKRMWDRFRRLRDRGVRILVPASCLSEWWRKSARQAAIRPAIRSSIVLVSESVACAAGEALGSLDRRRHQTTPALTIDAQVMATAALAGGGAVLTSDPSDLGLFARHFPDVVIEAL